MNNLAWSIDRFPPLESTLQTRNIHLLLKG